MLSKQFGEITPFGATSNYIACESPHEAWLEAQVLLLVKKFFSLSFFSFRRNFFCGGFEYLQMRAIDFYDDFDDFDILCAILFPVWGKIYIGSQF